MPIRHASPLAACAALLLPATAACQDPGPRPEDTEVWEPVPPVVTPGPPSAPVPPPSDAVVLFDGSGLDGWVNVSDGSPAGWRVEADGSMTVVKAAGDIQTRRRFGSYQLHVEWRIPSGITGEGQERGNSGVFLAFLEGLGGYELQVLDSYGNETYVNGMAGSVYKQFIPLANAMRPPGEWQVYDIVWTAPTFDADGSVATPARITAFHNGVLIQNDVELRGDTRYRGEPQYHAYDRAPLMLQAHQDPSPPISFRNIWLRELP